MYFEQFYLGCLAHASYLLGSEGEAIVVDPQRDVDLYLRAADEQHLKIRHIVETHLHADFVSGHQELAARTGATIYIGRQAEAKFPHVAVGDDSTIHAGKLSVRVLSTPGHTPESICLVVTDSEKSADPWAVLTGDTLFIGDVGRPDLSPDYTPAQLADMLYDSLHQKLLKLPDHVLVYPAHGAGSLCGRNMRAERSSTIGTERLTNYALQIKSKEEFVRQLTSNLPARPEYFSQDAEINRTGAGMLAELPELPVLLAEQVKSFIDDGIFVLDVRLSEDFATAHVPGSINIPLSGQFASWSGSILGVKSRPVLIADSAERLAEARIRLARVGIDDIRGYLKDGVEGWKRAGLPIARITQVTVQELRDRMDESGMEILDVRRAPEWQAGHLEGATWWPLDNFRVSPPEIDRERTTAVHCKGGYRSMIACSLLQRAGFRHVINVIGGFDAWEQAKLPVVTEKPVEV